jgi:hypothetical protein
MSDWNSEFLNRNNLEQKKKELEKMVGPEPEEPEKPEEQRVLGLLPMGRGHVDPLKPMKEDHKADVLKYNALFGKQNIPETSFKEFMRVIEQCKIPMRIMNEKEFKLTSIEKKQKIEDLEAAIKNKDIKKIKEKKKILWNIIKASQGNELNRKMRRKITTFNNLLLELRDRQRTLDRVRVRVMIDHKQLFDRFKFIEEQKNPEYNAELGRMNLELGDILQFVRRKKYKSSVARNNWHVREQYWKKWQKQQLKKDMRMKIRLVDNMLESLDGQIIDDYMELFDRFEYIKKQKDPRYLAELDMMNLELSSILKSVKNKTYTSSEAQSYNHSWYIRKKYWENWQNQVKRNRADKATKLRF